MKFSEMNRKQQKAFANMVYASNWLIGGLVNTTYDYDGDSGEYRNAVECLNDTEYLINELYQMTISEVYGEGSVCFNKQAESYLKDIRFCGKDWLMERCRRRIAKMQKRGDLEYRKATE